MVELTLFGSTFWACFRNYTRKWKDWAILLLLTLPKAFAKWLQYIRWNVGLSVGFGGLGRAIYMEKYQEFPASCRLWPLFRPVAHCNIITWMQLDAEFFQQGPVLTISPMLPSVWPLSGSEYCYYFDLCCMYICCKLFNFRFVDSFYQEKKLYSLYSLIHSILLIRTQTDFLFIFI